MYTIEQARKEYAYTYNSEFINPLVKIKLKCWINHCESRNKNNHEPFKFVEYNHIMRIQDYIDQIELKMIDVSDLFDGNKEQLVSYLNNWR